VSCDITADAIVCENTTGLIASVPDQVGVSYLWTVTGDGEAVSGTSSHELTWKSNLIQTGSVQISVTVTNTSTGCWCSNSTIVAVQAEPTAEGGPDQTICVTQNANLMGTATNFTLTSWEIISGPGSLIIDPNDLKNATYVPVVNPFILDSKTILAFNATAKSPCSSIASDYVNITVYQVPIVSIEVIKPK
jgi:hypothetical protein